MLTTERLLATIKAVAPAVVDVSIGTVGNPATVFVSPSSQQAAAQATIDAFPWTQAAQDAWEKTANKTLAKAILDDIVPIGRAERAVIGLIVSELNLLRAWITSFQAATAAATSLANLQTRVAALNAMPARTGAQVTQAIKDAIDAET